MKIFLQYILYQAVIAIGILLSPASLNAQHSECPKLLLAAPDSVMPHRTIDVFSKIDPESVAQPVNWLVVKENDRLKTIEVETIEKQKEITIPIWDSNDSGRITVIAIASFSSRCQAKTVHRVYVTENIGTPVILDEYSNLKWNDERSRLDIVIAEMANRPKFELLIFMNFRASVLGSARRQKVSQILRHITQNRKADPSKITFVLSTEPMTDVKFQLVPQDMVDIFTPELALIIPSEKFGKFEQLFRN